MIAPTMLTVMNACIGASPAPWKSARNGRTAGMSTVLERTLAPVSATSLPPEIPRVLPSPEVMETMVRRRRPRM